MSICVNVTGIIEFSKIPFVSLTETIKKYDPEAKIEVENNILRIKNAYCHYPIIQFISSYLKENINNIYAANISCCNWIDDDVPSQVIFEIWDGIFYEQTVEKHISSDWWFNCLPILESTNDIDIENIIFE